MTPPTHLVHFGFKQLLESEQFLTLVIRLQLARLAEPATLALDVSD